MDGNLEKFKNLVNAKGLSGQVVISIDGACGGGKTTFANEIERELHYNILHMDDFYLPFDKRDKNWMNIIAGHMDFDRLIENVLKPYKAKKKTNYISYDCHNDKYLQEIPIDLENFLVIEGSYTAHPILSEYVDLKIFVDIDKDDQIKRLTKRNPAVVDKFLSMWVPFENRYFEELKIKDISDLVISV
jgi:uridine kinase